ncbi:polyprenol phosphomannose-dependent alpha 1,6 mannosyltransferase MptB [Streptomyces sp. NPDC047928]|uniref:polyprenol phosphomannose-dependent alpha 1,6 mannosyltransferase MptB n=1 Tax=unclassified Streptomyces TaxID=2593676 RepID=UPI003713D4B9
MWSLSAVGCRRLGAAGSLAVAAAGWGAGALPARDPWGLWVPRGSGVTLVATVVAYAGLTLLVAAWWRYGRLLARRDPAPGGVREVLGTLLWWTAPLLLAPPLYSADVYSYIAQGAMVVEGHDVYRAGPSVLDPHGIGGDAAASVGGNWTDTPAPYGPVFLLLAQTVTRVTDGTIVPAVLGMRLIALGALALIVWALPRLPRPARSPRGSRGNGDRNGNGDRDGDGSGALWLGALNPLLLIHVVGGLHNDGLMAGLMLAGVVLALRGRPVAGGALVGLAMMVKTPAGLALLFIAVAVGRAASGPLPARVAKALVPGAAAVAVAAGASLLAGTGFGWLGTQSVAGAIHTALSATSDLGLGLGELLHLLAGVDPGPVKRAVQSLGLMAALALVAHLAVRAGRGRLDPAHALGLALLALVALSPMVQPWYPLWGAVVVAATAWDGRAGRVVAVLSAALVYETAPTGATPAYGFVLAGAVCAAGAYALSRPGRTPLATTGTPEPSRG